MTGLQRIPGVINSGMDDATVASAGTHAEAGILLQQKNVRPMPRKFHGYSAADYAAADDQNVGLVHYVSWNYFVAKSNSFVRAASLMRHSVGAGCRICRRGYYWRNQDGSLSGGSSKNDFVSTKRASVPSWTA